MTQRAKDLLGREMYWVEEARVSPMRDLRARIEGLVDALQADMVRPFPARDPFLSGGPRWRRVVKRVLYRLLRPITRRHDRLVADLAAISLELLDHLGRLEDELRRVEERLSEAKGDAD